MIIKIVYIIFFSILLIGCSTVKSKEKIHTLKLRSANDWNHVIIKKNRDLEGELDTIQKDRFWEILNIPDSINIEYVIVSYLHGYKECGGAWSKGSVYNSMAIAIERLEHFPNFQWLFFHSGEVELDLYNEIAPHKKDVDDEINSMFFGGHTRCSSYIVVRKDGKYIGWLSELSIRGDVPKMVKRLMLK